MQLNPVLVFIMALIAASAVAEIFKSGGIYG